MSAKVVTPFVFSILQLSAKKVRGLKPVLMQMLEGKNST